MKKKYFLESVNILKLQDIRIVLQFHRIHSEICVNVPSLQIVAYRDIYAYLPLTWGSSLKHLCRYEVGKKICLHESVIIMK